MMHARTGPAGLWLAAFIAVAASVGPRSAQADDAARLAAAREVIRLSQGEQMMVALLPATLDQVFQMIGSMRPDLTEPLTAIRPMIEREFGDRSGEAIDLVAAVYASRFTVEELDALAAFYRSPVGIKFAAEMPEMAMELLSVGNEFGQRIAVDMWDRVRAELTQRGYKVD